MEGITLHLPCNQLKIFCTITCIAHIINIRYLLKSFQLLYLIVTYSVSDCIPPVPPRTQCDKWGHHGQPAPNRGGQRQLQWPLPLPAPGQLGGQQCVPQLVEGGVLDFAMPYMVSIDF